MNNREIEAITTELASVVREHIDATVAPVLQRLATAEAKMAEMAADDIADLHAVKSDIESLRKAIVELPDTAKMIADLVEPVRDQREQDAAQIKAWMDGIEQRFEEVLERDIDARIIAAMEGTLDNDDVKAICEQLIGDLPKPVDGKDGRDGIDGKDGLDGKDGRDGVDGKDGQDGANGKDGIDGKDGLDAREFIRANGRLIVTMSDGSTKDLGEIDGKDGEPGKPGKDGRDGFSLKNFDAELKDDGRTLLLKFVDEGQAFSVEIPMPTMIYRGVYRDGQEYKQGDTVTWAGNLWHCDTDTTDKPDGEQRCWTLAVRKGRDGKK